MKSLNVLRKIEKQKKVIENRLVDAQNKVKKQTKSAENNLNFIIGKWFLTDLDEQKEFTYDQV